MKKYHFLLLIAPLLFIGKLSAQGCLPAGLTFSTQGQIDSFAIQYPGCTKILGSITIKESVAGNITNLLGLSQIDSIAGALEIGVKIDWLCFGTSLTSLSGLGNLTYIGGQLQIRCNDSLASLSGLSSLVSIGGDFFLSYNSSLSSVSGLDNITSINGFWALTTTPP
ncbi:MAG: hypothetical protein IPL63_18605 [Saprospiraceae bacterium]|nr:hypothetical protein [Saprospiraceae bacterium]